MYEKQKLCNNHDFFSKLNRFFILEKSNIIHVAGTAKSGYKGFLKSFYKWYLENSSHRIFILDYDRNNLKNAFNILGELKDRIYLSKMDSNYSLEDLLRRLSSKTSPLKPGDILVLESISHIVKAKLTESFSYLDYQKIIHYFIDNIFPKIYSVIKKTQCNLVIIHHVSYSPEFETNLPVFHDLMQILNGLWILLYPQEFMQETPFNKNLMTLSYSWTENNVKKQYFDQYYYHFGYNFMQIIEHIEREK